MSSRRCSDGTVLMLPFHVSLAPPSRTQSNNAYLPHTIKQTCVHLTLLSSFVRPTLSGICHIHILEGICISALLFLSLFPHSRLPEDPSRSHAHKCLSPLYYYNYNHAFRSILRSSFMFCITATAFGPLCCIPFHRRCMIANSFIGALPNSLFVKESGLFPSLYFL